MSDKFNILISADLNQRLADFINLSDSMSKLDPNLYFWIVVNSVKEKKFFGHLENDKIKPIFFYSNSINIFRRILLSLILIILKILRNLPFRVLTIEKITSFFQLLKFKWDYKRAKEIFDSVNPNVILTCGDRHPSFEASFLKISKEFNIKVIIPYLAIFGSGINFLPMRNSRDNIYNTKKIKPSVLNHFKNKYPQNIIEGYFFYRPHVAMALNKFGTLTNNPWYIGCGLSDIVCMCNRYDADQHIKYGVNKSKIRITGDTSYDIIYNKLLNKESIRQEKIEKYNLDKYKKIIIIAFPQLAEHNILTWDKHWEEIRFIGKSLNELDVNVLASLHPKMNKKSYAFLETEYGFKILDERLNQILPIADMFIATFSSTVVWAVLCGIKTVILNFYGLNSEYYNYLKSPILVEDKEILNGTINELMIKDIDFSNDWKILSRSEVFDGETIKRYVEILKNL